MENFTIWVLIGMPTLSLGIVVLWFLPRRLRMERRARSLLAANPDAERTSIYCEFRSIWHGAKKADTEARISEMQAAGWTFLKESEANPLRTMRSWAGGVNLHFIRSPKTFADQ